MKPGFAGMGPQRDEITLGKTRYHKAPNPDVLDIDFLLPVILSVAWLCSSGESFFSLTRRLPAEALVADGWIGRDGIRAAAEEFKLGGYGYIVVTGDMTEDRRNQSDYAETAEQELIGLGIPKDRIITAPSSQVARQRHVCICGCRMEGA